MNKKLGIKVISEACGIVPHTIRTWEARYKIFEPARADNGQRLYSEKDLLKAKLVAKLIDAGHGISKVASLEIAQLEELIQLTVSKDEDKETHKPLSKLGQTSLKRLFKQLTDYKIDMVASEIEHLRMSVGAKDFIFDVVLPVMQKIGLMVAKGKYSVTQEHIISTIVRGQLSQICLPNLGSKDESVILATPDGNMHELSILIADILCRSNRVSTSYLGASHPHECLAEAINALKSKTLILGVVSSDGWNYEKNMVSYLEGIDGLLNFNIKVILGGATKIKMPKFKKISEVHFIASFEDFDNALENRTLASTGN